MKKMVLFFGMIAVLILTNCAKDELVYSCDPVIDRWVVDHLEEIKKMDRKTWLTYPLEYGKPIFRAFTPEQQVEFWKDKFMEVKSLEWSAEALAHIELMEEFILNHRDFFEGKKLTDEQNDELDVFCYKWQTYAIEKLGWTKMMVVQMIMSGYPMQKYGEEAATRTSPPPGGSLDPAAKLPCGCNLKHDFCDDTNHAVECKKTGCSEKEKGCGWLVLQPCNGTCEWP